MSIDISLLNVLADPIDKKQLLWLSDHNRLYNPHAHRAYSVNNGVPALVASEAIEVNDEEHQRLITR